MTPEAERPVMKLTFEDYDQLTVLAVQGELVADQADRFRREVIEHMTDKVRDFVLDLAAMEFVDSEGLETMLWLQDRCADRLGQVRLAGAQDHVRTILKMTRLAARFDCHEDVDAAVRSLR